MVLRSLLFAAIAALPCLGCGSNAEPPKVPDSTQAKPPELEEPTSDDSALLEVICNPPVKVLIDGKDVGESPVSNHKVNPGHHEVTCNDDETGPRTLMVDLGPNDSKSLSSNRIPKIQEAPRPDKDKAEPKKK